MYENIMNKLPEKKINKEESSMPVLSASDKRIKMYVMGAYDTPIDRIIRIKMIKGVI